MSWKTYCRMSGYASWIRGVRTAPGDGW